MAKDDGTGVTIPETSEELAEIVADDDLRGQVFASPEKTQEFLVNYVGAVNKAKPDIQAMVNEGVKVGLSDYLKEQGVTTIVRPDLEPKAGPGVPRGAAYNKRAPGVMLDNEFEDTAAFLYSIYHQNQAGQDQWRKIRADMSTIDPATGGFLVPERLRSELLRIALETAIVRSRARTIPMDSSRVPFPVIDSTSNASSVFGGVTATWTEEGGTLAESEAKFGRIVLQASKLATRVDVPNELLTESIISFAAFIDEILPAAIAWFEDTAFLTGTGVGQPLGVLNSPALVTQAKETGQAANTIVWQNLIKMYSRMLPASLGSAVWLVNNDTFPQLAQMSLDVGTGGSAIWLNNGVAGPPMTILGRPVIMTEKVPTVGDANDVSFIDFSYYLIGDRMQMRAESSAHAQFTTDQTVYRVIERVDGRGWIQSAITPQNGTNTLSPFIALAERA